MNTVSILVDHNPNDVVIASLREGIVGFNSKFLHEKASQFIITAKNNKNDIVGGATIWEHSDALYIDILWVEENYRGKGVGSRLINAIVEQAKLKNIKKLFVDTYDFQASGFYIKHGFFIIGRLDNYLLGHDRIYLRMDIEISGAEMVPSSISDDQIYIEENFCDTIANYLATELKRYNKSIVGHYQRKPYAIYIKLKSGEIIAGIKGDVFERICSVHLMWVHENYRQQGFGKKIMLKLDKYATKKGCKFIQLDTVAFQAKDFYEKLGFHTIATLPEGFMGHDQYIMRKIL